MAKELFQSTLPIQGETEFQVSRAFVDKFQSTLPIQGETLHLCYNVNSFYYFNPLSLYRERRFNPAIQQPKIYFNPLSLYRERQRTIGTNGGFGYISIHSPYTGRDPHALHIPSHTCIFQSTLPIQGETQASKLLHILRHISIHSPYTGRDLQALEPHNNFFHFNPLSLYRERQQFCT